MTEEEKKQQKELWKQDRIRARHEEWLKIRNMGAGARIRYFWDYYKIVLAIALAAVLLIYLGVTIFLGMQTKMLLYVCFLNTDVLDPDTETLRGDYIQARGGLEKMQDIIFDSSVWVNPDADGTSREDVAASIKITSYVGAGTLDVFLAPSYVTKYEQELGMLMKLEDVLTPDEIRVLGEAGCLYYEKEPETDAKTGAPIINRTDTETEGAAGFAADNGQSTRDGTQESAFFREEEYPLNTRPQDGTHIYAVRIDPAGVIGNYEIYGDGRQVWFSVIGNSARTEEAVRFLHFLLGKEDAASRRARLSNNADGVLE